MFNEQDIRATATSVSSLLLQSRVVDNSDAFARLYESAVGDENRIRYQAQSILTCVFAWPELPSISEARDILAWANRGVPA